MKTSISEKELTLDITNFLSCAVNQFKSYKTQKKDLTRLCLEKFNCYDAVYAGNNFKMVPDKEGLIQRIVENTLDKWSRNQQES